MKRILVVVLIMLTACTSRTKENPPIPAPHNFSSIRNEIIHLVKDGKTPSFSIAVLQNGKILWQEAFEQLDDTSSVSISSNAQFPLASLTKSMSATVLLKLVENQQVSLDDKIHKYLPNQINYYSRKNSTIRELLNMSAGIPHGGMSFNSESSFAKMENDSLISNIYGMTVFPSGIQEYSNFSYGIIESIIEKITNKPYALVLKEELFEPLGMKNSFIEPTQSNKLKNNSVKSDKVFSSKFLPSGAAGVYSTLSDLILYARLNLNEIEESLISQKTLNKLHYEKINPASMMALGWGSISLGDNLTWILSNGSFPNSANSNLSIIPEHNIAVICLANRDYQSKADIMAIKAINVLIDGFADKAFAKMEDYDSADSKNLSFENSSYDIWEGTLKSSLVVEPIKFMFESDSLFVSYKNSKWQFIEYARMDHQSIIRGQMKIPLINPITKQLEQTTGAINLLIGKDELEGYYSASFSNKNVVFLELPFYIKVHGKSN